MRKERGAVYRRRLWRESSFWVCAEKTKEEQTNE